jgi:hypothetical protein
MGKRKSRERGVSRRATSVSCRPSKRAKNENQTEIKLRQVESSLKFVTLAVARWRAGGARAARQT